jgi:UDP-N-acetylglucosamine 2-epimerase (non-hydrolysing)
MKIASVVGARPQFIKFSSVSREIRKKHEEVLIHTGQHYDYEMDKIFFDELGIPEPKYNLGVGSGSHAYQTGEMLKGVENVLLKEKPDLVLVYGDTNSTLAGALAAAKINIPIGHIEAGLRSFDKTMPEEINRLLTDHISHMLFAPTHTAVNNLKKEGITNGVYLVGDVMIDALMQTIKIAEEKTKILDILGLDAKQYLLVTVHRAENTDKKENLREIIKAILKIEERIVFPIHPRTEKCIKKYGWYEKIRSAKNVVLIKPVGYFDMLVLEKNAKKVLTDSGGVQKEAYIFKVPCITLRNVTEWVETVKDGWNMLAGPNEQRIIWAIKEFWPKGKQKNLLGDGKASVKIAALLKHDMVMP